MNVFVTGHRGYIGVHLVELLKSQGHTVTGCDLGLFDGCEWESFTIPDRELKQDVRKITIADLANHDCVMHLAAISNDPMGDLNPEITFSINRDASIRLAKLAKKAGVKKFIFSGSCSIYGKGEQNEALNENAELNPLTAYAKSKIETETEVTKLADNDFSPIFLRNATAYGYSPMLRVDLVVNNLLASALSYGEIRIMSDGSPWRPLIHCRDIARAFIAFMEVSKDIVHNQAVNVGGNDENFQVRQIGDRVQELMPEATIMYTGEHGSDSRDYKVSFKFLKQLLPDFRLQYTLRTGMSELFEKMKSHEFGKTDLEGDKFIRLRALNKRINELL